MVVQLRCAKSGTILPCWCCWHGGITNYNLISPGCCGYLLVGANLGGLRLANVTKSIQKISSSRCRRHNFLGYHAPPSSVLSSRMLFRRFSSFRCSSGVLVLWLLAFRSRFTATTLDSRRFFSRMESSSPPPVPVSEERPESITRPFELEFKFCEPCAMRRLRVACKDSVFLQYFGCCCHT